MGDCEIFHVQLLKMVTKNDPGNYDNFILVHIVTAVSSPRYFRVHQKNDLWQNRFSSAP